MKGNVLQSSAVLLALLILYLVSNSLKPSFNLCIMQFSAEDRLAAVFVVGFSVGGKASIKLLWSTLFKL